ncbi:hypothetical protein BG004_007440 [Podila humilis]|nr:hypothetical protein BG004_007440 [Podila humilis]
MALFAPNLPVELLLVILMYLDQDDSTRHCHTGASCLTPALVWKCMRISRAWYSALEPIFCANISLLEQQQKRQGFPLTQTAISIPFPSLQSLYAHRELVQDLTINLSRQQSSSIFATASFKPTFASLAVNGNNTRQDCPRLSEASDYARHIMSFIGHTWPLQIKPHAFIPQIPFPNLERLVLKGLDFNELNLDISNILQALPRLWSLTLSSVTHAKLDDSRPLVLPRLFSLVLDDVNKTSQDLIRLLDLNVTPNLNRLALNRIEFSPQKKQRQHPPGTPQDPCWPLLQTIIDRCHMAERPIEHLDTLDAWCITEDRLCDFLTMLPKNTLKTVSLSSICSLMSSPGDDVLPIVALEHHLESLQTLVLRGLGLFGGVMVRKSIHLFPHLRELCLTGVWEYDSFFFNDPESPWPESLERIKTWHGNESMRKILMLFDPSVLRVDKGENSNIDNNNNNNSNDGEEFGQSFWRRRNDAPVLRRYQTGTDSNGSTQTPMATLEESKLTESERAFLECIAGMKRLQEFAMQSDVFLTDKAALRWRQQGGNKVLYGQGVSPWEEEDEQGQGESPLQPRKRDDWDVNYVYPWDTYLVQ